MSTRVPRSLLVAFAALALLTPIAGDAAPTAASAPPAKSPLPPARTAPTTVKAPIATPAAAKATHAKRPVRHRRVARPAKGPLVMLGRANAEARDAPAAGVFVNSTLFYAFEPGRLYDIHTSPRFLTTIALRPGEKLISKALGDSVRWVLGETEAGTGAAPQVIVLIKPMRPGLRTNIVLTTDQRTYLIDATSTTSAAYTSMLSWTYPQEEAKASAEDQARREAVRQQASAAVVQADIPIDRFDFRYRIGPVKGRAPAWQPVRVFDDGAKTYIEFPPDLAVHEAPPLFLLGPKGQAQLVNYRLLGRYVVVDRLIDQAELRLGNHPQTIVRITRQGERS